jgi:uncharacterized protein
MKHNWQVIKSDNSNFYLFSPRKEEQPLLLHPIISYLLSIKNLPEWFKKQKKKSFIRIDEFDKIPFSTLKFYYKKIQFYKKNGLLDSIEYRLSHVNNSQIKKNIYAIKYLAFEITESCNLKCDYCIYSGYYSNINRKSAKLDFKTGKNIINEIFKGASNGFFPYDFSISFYGGEPLMNFNFIKDIVTYVKESKPKQKFRFSMTSNALLLDKYMDFLIENKFDLLLSLDGSEEDNKYRKKANGEYSFQKVYSNIHKLKNRNIDYFKNYVQINSVTKEGNEDIITAYIKKEFNIMPRIASIKTFNLNPKNKELFYEEFYGTSEENQIKKEKQKAHKNKKFGFQFDSYYELYKAKLLFEKVHISHFPTYSMTCLPFDKKMYISSRKNVFHCDKVPYTNMLDRISENNGIFNIKKITDKTNMHIDKIKEYCDNCFNDKCPVCLHSEKINTDQKCKYFISESEYFMNISSNISSIENS